MDPIFLAIIAVVLLGGVGAVLYLLLLAPNRQRQYRALMSGGNSTGFSSAQLSARHDTAEEAALRLKEQLHNDALKKRGNQLQEKLFTAGYFSDQEQANFNRIRIILPCITAPLFALAIGSFAGVTFGLIGLVMGVLVGLQLPYTFLDRKIAARSEEIMFYLPLAIEQISIGVSSSLDIGPCLQRVVQMAEERDSLNVVTEFVKHTQMYVKSGVSLEDALVEVGKLSGHTELKHTFMSLAQVAKHGGEISKQLQELADAVASQRETSIEERIKKLELKATGPVAMVFFGFMITLLVGMGVKIMEGFKATGAK
jgi:Flp pilus assembly protein TadB